MVWKKPKIILKNSLCSQMEKTFEIDLEIYPENIVLQAIEDFSDVWEILFKTNTIIIAWDSEVEIDEIFNELMNYVIWLVN